MSDFLQALAQELRTQDNAATAEPIFMVEELRPVYGLDPDYSDGTNIVFIDEECNELKGEELVDAESYWEQHHDTPDYITRTVRLDQWFPVQAFLTRKAAEAYMVSQRHNHGRLRVYVASAHRNPEMRELRRELMRAYPAAAQSEDCGSDAAELLAWLREYQGDEANP